MKIISPRQMPRTYRKLEHDAYYAILRYESSGKVYRAILASFIMPITMLESLLLKILT